MPSESAEHLLATRAWDQIRTLDPAGTTRFVEELGDLAASDPAPDVEQLVATGLALSAATHATAGGAALDWLAAVPTPERMGVVSALLNGLWRQASQCSDDRVARLLELRDQLAGQLDVGDEYMFARALAVAATCGRLHPAELDHLLRAAFRDSVGRLPEDMAQPLRQQSPWNA
jgi:hypothetical protein